jgi:hypothetical protein
MQTSGYLMVARCKLYRLCWKMGSVVACHIKLLKFIYKSNNSNFKHPALPYPYRHTHFTTRSDPFMLNLYHSSSVSTVQYRFWEVDGFSAGPKISYAGGIRNFITVFTNTRWGHCPDQVNLSPHSRYILILSYNRHLLSLQVFQIDWFMCLSFPVHSACLVYFTHSSNIMAISPSPMASSFLCSNFLNILVFLCKIRGLHSSKYSYWGLTDCACQQFEWTYCFVLQNVSMVNHVTKCNMTCSDFEESSSEAWISI